jgi:hypothetical protein
MTLPRFASRRLIMAGALFAVALVSIVIFQCVRSADPSKLAAGEASGLEVKRRSLLTGTGEMLCWNPMGTILCNGRIR